MSIANYGELKTAVADWLNRDDSTTINRIPSFISFAEAEVSRDLRHWLQEKRISTVCDEEYEFLPDDWLETVSLRLSQGDEVRLVSQAQMAEMKMGVAPSSGKPTHYTIAAGQLEFYPTPDGSANIVLTYYARIPALAADDSTNWLLTNEPDVLLYASLKHASSFLDDDQRLEVWKRLYDQAISRLTVNSDAAKHSGPLVMRIKAL